MDRYYIYGVNFKDNGKIYNFNTHKYLSNRAEILYAKAYSDIMPKEIWRLIYIVNYQIISIDVDDNKCYLINDFEDSYKDVYDKNAKKRILKNGYFTPKFQKKALLNKQNLENIKSSNIFIAVLENIAYSEKSFSEDENLINITYEGINELAFILEDMLKNEEIILPKGRYKFELPRWTYECEFTFINSKIEYPIIVHKY